MLSIPTSLFGGAQPKTAVQAALFSVELTAVAVIAVVTLARQWARIRSGVTEVERPSGFLRISGPTYLAVLAVLWASALPGYFGASHGVTADGTPVGSLAYAVASFVGAALCLAGLLTVARRPSLPATPQPV